MPSPNMQRPGFLGGINPNGDDIPDPVELGRQRVEEAQQSAPIEVRGAQRQVEQGSPVPRDADPETAQGILEGMREEQQRASAEAEERLGGAKKMSKGTGFAIGFLGRRPEEVSQIRAEREGRALAPMEAGNRAAGMYLRAHEAAREGRKVDIAGKVAEGKLDQDQWDQKNAVANRKFEEKIVKLKQKGKLQEASELFGKQMRLQKQRQGYDTKARLTEYSNRLEAAGEAEKAALWRQEIDQMNHLERLYVRNGYDKKLAKDAAETQLENRLLLNNMEGILTGTITRKNADTGITESGPALTMAPAATLRSAGIVTRMAGRDDSNIPEVGEPVDDDTPISMKPDPNNPMPGPQDTIDFSPFGLKDSEGNPIGHVPRTFNTVNEAVGGHLYVPEWNQHAMDRADPPTLEKMQKQNTVIRLTVAVDERGREQEVDSAEKRKKIYKAQTDKIKEHGFMAMGTPSGT